MFRNMYAVDYFLKMDANAAHLRQWNNLETTGTIKLAQEKKILPEVVNEINEDARSQTSSQLRKTLPSKKTAKQLSVKEDVVTFSKSKHSPKTKKELKRTADRDNSSFTEKKILSIRSLSSGVPMA
eukprot:Awhi_evm1s9050